jgi:hypothetical protein
MHGFRENKTLEQILTFRNQVLFSHHRIFPNLLLENGELTYKCISTFFNSFSSVWEHI